jgi:hypothetical protein
MKWISGYFLWINVDKLIYKIILLGDCGKLGIFYELTHKLSPRTLQN